MVRIASLWVCGVISCTMSVAGPVGNQQNPSLLPAKGTKDTLVSGASATPPSDPYGFKPLLADNAATVAIAPSATTTAAHSLTYSAQAHALVAGYQREFIRSDKEKLTHMKSWGAPYFTRIERILADHNLPKQLEYLAVIESELKHSATSRVGAKGIWQFMPSTARLYGLTVNGRRDDRTDLDKSTRAAARYLQDMYDELHDWLLVIAAYDGGTVRIHSAIRKAGSRDFFDIQYYLPMECRNHVKRFIATNFFMEDVPTAATTSLLPGGTQELQSVLTEEDLENTEVQTITGHYTAAAIARHLSVPLPEFIRLNPNFDTQLAGAEECYNLRLPKDKMTLFNEEKKAILSESIRALLNEDENEQK